MEDKRKNNGGNSTKAKGVDKRKNTFKSALIDASTPQDVIDIINVVKKTAKNGDLNACKLFLAYYLGNPKDTVENTHNVTKFDIKDLFKFDSDKG